MFTYLASPYSHTDPEVRQARFETVCKVALELMKKGEAIFCPIAHSHPIDVLGEQGDHDFWMKQDIPILRHAAKMKVLKLEGWEKSRGIKQEIETAEKLFIPVYYITPSDVRSPGEKLRAILQGNSYKYA